MQACFEMDWRQKSKNTGDFNNSSFSFFIYAGFTGIFGRFENGRQDRIFEKNARAGSFEHRNEARVKTNSKLQE